MVILGIGVRPTVELARTAGLENGSVSALKVDGSMRPPDPEICAASDCVQSSTGNPRWRASVDGRSPAEHQPEHLAGSTFIPLGALRSRLGELPKDKEIITFCKVSLRGYEAAKILQGAGFCRVRVMDGDLAVWPCEKVRQ